MATAVKSKSLKREERVVFEWREVPQYDLKLSKEEAEFISAMTAKVSGDPGITYRKLSDNIRKALKAAGVEEPWGAFFNTGNPTRQGFECRKTEGNN